MEIPVSDAKAKLTDLVRRAEAGEEIVLTRHGQPVVQFVPLTKRKPTAEEKMRVMEEVARMARAKGFPKPGDEPADRAADFLYDEDGMPV